MAYYDAIDNFRKASILRNDGKIRKTSIVIVSHVHSTIKHDGMSIYIDYNTASTDVYELQPYRIPCPAPKGITSIISSGDDVSFSL